MLRANTEEDVLGYEDFSANVAFTSDQQDQAFKDELSSFRKSLVDLLGNYGFKDSIDLAAGITSLVCVFKYTGDDADVSAITKYGYIIVKIPPPNNLNNCEDKLRHSQLTYANEIEMIRILGLKHSEKRTAAVVKKFGDHEFILSSPVFYELTKFLPEENQIQEEIEDIECEVDYIKTQLLTNSAQLSHGEQADLLNEYQALKCGYNNLIERRAINIKDNIYNLDTYMKMLGNIRARINPIINQIYAGMISCVAEIHNEAILHLDIACRNFVISSIEQLRIQLIDFGNADHMNVENGRAIRNFRFPSRPVACNHDAAVTENFIYDIRTDFIALQKAMIEALYIYMGIDFYTISTTAMLVDGAAPVNQIAVVASYSDEAFLNNAIIQLRRHAEFFKVKKDIRGEEVLSVLNVYQNFLTRDAVLDVNCDKAKMNYLADFHHVTAAEKKRGTPKKSEHALKRSDEENCNSPNRLFSPRKRLQTEPSAQEGTQVVMTMNLL